MGATIDTITLETKKIPHTTLPVIFEKSEALPIFNLQLVFQNSGYLADGNKSGLTHLTAKLLGEGTKKDGATQFASKLESKAISINTSNGFETFVIEVSCLESEYKEALKLLLSLLKDPNLSEDTLQKLKTLQISKLKQKESDFDTVARNNLSKILWKGTPLQNNNSGDIESLEQITLSDIKNHLKKTLNLDTLLIAVGGKIELETFKKDIKPILEVLTKNGKSPTPHFSINKKPQEKRVKKNTEQAYIYFGSEFTLPYDSQEIYKAKVASFILGGSGFGSRLMEEIRVKNGLAYSAYGHTSINKTHTYFTGYLQTKLDNETKAKELVKKTIEDFVTNGATQEELDGAKKFLSGSEPLRSETFSQRLGLALNLYYKGLDQSYPKQELEMIEHLTLEELNSFIRSHKEILNLSFSIVTK